MISFIEFYIFIKSTKEVRLDISLFLFYTISFLFVNLFLILTFRMILILSQKKKIISKKNNIIITVFRYLKDYILNLYLFSSCVYFIINTRSENNSSSKSEEDQGKIIIYLLLNKFYNLNLISTFLLFFLNSRENKTFKFIHILLILLPNFFSIIHSNFFLNDITYLIFHLIISLVFIYIRTSIFSFLKENIIFINKNKNNLVLENLKKDKNSSKELQINEKINYDNFNSHSSNIIYFEFLDNKIRLINNNFKNFIKENFQYESTYKNEDGIKFEKILPKNGNESLDENKFKQSEFDIISNQFLKNLKLFQKVEKNFVDKIKEFFNIAKKNWNESNYENKEVNIDSYKQHNHEFAKTKNLKAKIKNIKVPHNEEYYLSLKKGDSLLVLINKLFYSFSTFNIIKKDNFKENFNEIISFSYRKSCNINYNKFNKDDINIEIYNT